MTIHAAEEYVFRSAEGAGKAGRVVVPFPRGEGGVTVPAEQFGQKGMARIESLQRPPNLHIIADRGPENVRAGVDAGPGRHTDRAAQPSHVAVLPEGRAFVAELIQRWRLHRRIAVSADCRGAVVVGNEEKNIGLG